MPDKHSSFLRRTAVSCLSACILASLMMLAVLALCRIVPFGDNTFLYDDMKREYADFYLYLRSALRGGNNVLYSLSSGPGGNLFGLFIYYLTSPLLLLSALIRPLSLPGFVTFLVFAKTVLLSVTMCLYLCCVCRQELSVVPDRSPRLFFLPVLSASYAFSGYFIENWTNTMWFDAILWMPLFFLCSRRLLDEDPADAACTGDASGAVPGQSRRPARFSTFVICAFSVCILLYLNFYIAYMILLFAAFCALFSGRPAGRLVRYAGSVFTGVLLSAGFLLPTILDLRESYRNPSADGFRIAFSQTPLRALSRVFFLSFDQSQIFSGAPALFCGLFALSALILFFISKDVRKAEKRQAAFALLFLTAGFCFEPLDVLWHGGALPNGFLYRFAFLFLFIVTVCAARAGFSVRELSVREIAISFGIPFLHLAACAAARYPYIASLKKILPNAVLLLSGVCLALAFTKFSGRSRKAVCCLLALAAVLHFGQLAGQAVYTYQYGAVLQKTASGFRKDYQETEAALAAASQALASSAKDALCRIESPGRHTENESLGHSYRSVSHDSSLQHRRITEFLTRLGFNHNGLFIVYEPGNTRSADTILGLAGFMSGDSFSPADISLPPVLPLSVPYEKLTAAAQDSKVHQDDPFLYAGSILQSYAGTDSGDLFIPAARTPLSAADDTGADDAVYSCTLTPAADGDLYIYLSGTRGDPEDYRFTYNNYNVEVAIGSRSNSRVMDMGTFKAGDSVQFTLYGDEPLTDPDRLLFYTEQTDVLHDLVRSAAPSAVRTEELSSSHYVVQTDDPAAQSLVLAVPYNRGWRCTVDGKRIVPECIFDAYMALPLEKGHPHVVDLKFIPLGLVPGCIVSLLAVILLAAVSLKIRNRGK